MLLACFFIFLFYFLQCPQPCVFSLSSLLLTPVTQVSPCFNISGRREIILVSIEAATKIGFCKPVRGREVEVRTRRFVHLLDLATLFLPFYAVYKMHMNCDVNLLLRFGAWHVGEKKKSSPFLIGFGRTWCLLLFFYLPVTPPPPDPPPPPKK